MIENLLGYNVQKHSEARGLPLRIGASIHEIQVSPTVTQELKKTQDRLSEFMPQPPQV